MCNVSPQPGMQMLKSDGLAEIESRNLIIATASLSSDDDDAASASARWRIAEAIAVTCAWRPTAHLANL
jgi:hypothetical protein